MNEYLTLHEMARKLGVTYQKLYRCSNRGVRSRHTGAMVKLKVWRTIRGLCTTDAAIDAFHAALNEEGGSE